MPLRVVSFCSYLATINVPWRPEDWDANKFVHAIKGHELNGYARVPVLGTLRRLNNANLDSAIDWFAEIAVDYLTRKRIKPPVGFIPIPNSGSTVRSSGRPQTAKLGKSITQKVGAGAHLLDCLRWKKNLGSAGAQGGPREASVLYENLSITDELKAVPYVLVDDVLTSGGHLQACAARLKEKGATVLMAVCAGRTVYTQPRNAFATIEEMLEDYEP